MYYGILYLRFRQIKTGAYADAEPVHIIASQEAPAFTVSANTQICSGIAYAQRHRRQLALKTEPVELVKSVLYKFQSSFHDAKIKNTTFAETIIFPIR
jgi:hypothetical protein